jgi:hypothetical protein
MLFAGLVVITASILLIAGEMYQRISAQQSELTEKRIYAVAQVMYLISLAQKVESSGAHFIITGKRNAFGAFLEAHDAFGKSVLAASKKAAARNC